MSDTATTTRLDVGTVLTSAADEHFLVIDILGAKVKLCRIPHGYTAADFGHTFWHDPNGSDPTRATLLRD